MVAHLIELRQVDAEYARGALQQYLAIEGCPCPDIERDVRNAWKRLNTEGK